MSMGVWVGVPILLIGVVVIGFFMSSRRKERRPHERRDIPPPL
jgi:hypothetical protein